MSLPWAPLLLTLTRTVRADPAAEAGNAGNPTSTKPVTTAATMASRRRRVPGRNPAAPSPQRLLRAAADGIVSAAMRALDASTAGHTPLAADRQAHPVPTLISDTPRPSHPHGGPSEVQTLNIPRRLPPRSGMEPPVGVEPTTTLYQSEAPRHQELHQRLLASRVRETVATESQDSPVARTSCHTSCPDDGSLVVRDTNSTTAACHATPWPGDVVHARVDRGRHSSVSLSRDCRVWPLTAIGHSPSLTSPRPTPAASEPCHCT